MSSVEVVAGALGVVVGAAAGAVSPAVIRRLPPPQPDADDRPVDYPSIAAQPHLAGYLAAVGAVVVGALTVLLPAWVLPGAVVVGVVVAPLAYVDLREHLLPDAILAPVAVLTLAALAVTAAVRVGWPRFVLAVVVAAATFVLFFLLALVAGGGFGFGDVKLAALLGLVAGWVGIGTAVMALVLAVLVGGLVTVALLATRRIERRQPVAFGPPLLFGWWASMLLAVVVTGPLPAG